MENKNEKIYNLEDSYFKPIIFFKNKKGTMEKISFFTIVPLYLFFEYLLIKNLYLNYNSMDWWKIILHALLIIFCIYPILIKHASVYSRFLLKHFFNKKIRVTAYSIYLSQIKSSDLEKALDDNYLSKNSRTIITQILVFRNITSKNNIQK